MIRGRRHALVALAAVVTACGQAASTAPSAAPAATPTPTPTPDPSLIAVAQDAGGGAATVGLYTRDGQRVTPPGVPTSGQIGVSGGMLTFVDQGVQKVLMPDRTIQALGPVRALAMVSPDAQHWMSSTVSNGAGGQISSRLVLSSRGVPDRVVAQETVVGRALQPYRWTAAGPIYQSAAIGIGGYILFDSAAGPVYRFDPVSGLVGPVLGGATCSLGDLAADGTVACLANHGATLDVIAPDGHTVAIPLPRPAFTQAGAISFGPGASSVRLVVGGATAAGADGGQERYEADLVDVAAGALRPFGPAGLRPAPGPWTWLPDGSLLAYRPAGAYGGDPGVYVVAPDGSARRVLASGTPLGVIA